MKEKQEIVPIQLRSSLVDYHEEIQSDMHVALRLTFTEGEFIQWQRQIYSLHPFEGAGIGMLLDYTKLGICISSTEKLV